MTERDLPSGSVLAGEWADALRHTAYVPLSDTEISDLLTDLAERLVTALAAPGVDTDSAAEVGARLVHAHFTGPRSLARTVEVLARVLRTHDSSRTAEPPGTEHPGTEHPGTDLLGERLATLLGALVTGYARALRDRVFAEQEEVQRALVSARQEAERHLQASEGRFHEVFDSSPMGIVISELDGTIVQTNPSLDATLGYAADELAGSELSDLLIPDDRPLAEDYYERLRSGAETRFRLRLRLRRRDGEPAWVYLAGSVLLDAEQQPHRVATMVADITELHLLKDWLNHQTLHDVQTGLPNRQYFITHLEEVLGRLPPSAVVTVLHLDLDGFAAINEGLGYHFGDQLLNLAGQRIAAIVGDERAMVARIGNDEFGILIESSGEPDQPPPNVADLAEAINTELAEPVYLGEMGVGVTATIGIVQRPVRGTHHSELLRAASATLRRLRGRGKRQWTLFDKDADTRDRTELRLAAALPGALETGELLVEYQPVMTVDGEQLVAVEAGLSWQRPQSGLLAHTRCTQVAERTGTVYALGQFLLLSAAREAMSWRERLGCAVPPVVVNLTTSQAQDPDLVAMVRAVLSETGLPPSGLELRMPVGALRRVDGLPAGEAGEYAEDNLTVLSELGVIVGLHDFAGGVGSLRCLAELPVATARVAEPVSRQVAEDPSRILSQAVRTLVHQARDAGVNVVAYPVDRTEQVGCWQWVGANWAVGSVYGRPGPPSTIDHLLRTTHGATTS